MKETPTVACIGKELTWNQKELDIRFKRDKIREFEKESSNSFEEEA